MPESVFVVSVVKEEADLVGPWCDHYASLGAAGLLVLDGSGDDTTDILQAKQQEYPGLLQTFRDDNPAHRQDLKITRLSALAHDLGAKVILPVDGDEFWQPVRGNLTDLAAAMDGPVWQVRQLFYAPSCRDDVTERNPRLRIRGHGPPTLKDAKVCYRWQPGSQVDMGNHAIVLPDSGRTYGELTAELIIHHYPYRSEDQFVAKIKKGLAGLAAAPELDADCCRHWRKFGRILKAESEEGLRARYRTEIYFDETRVGELIFDAESSQATSIT